MAGVESTHLAGKRGRFEFVNFGAKGSEKGRENRSGFLSPSTNVFFFFFVSEDLVSNCLFQIVFAVCP